MFATLVTSGLLVGTRTNAWEYILQKYFTKNMLMQIHTDKN